MPHVQVRVSKSLTQEQIEKLAEKTLNAIALIPGKSAPVTMAEIVPDCKLYYGSVEGEPCAVVDVACNNNPDPEALKAYSKEICKALVEIAGLDMKRIYIKHYGIPEWHTGKMFVE